MAKLLPGYTRADLRDAEDPEEGMRIAREATRTLKHEYHGRLRLVLLYGSWVRGEAHEESDVDLLVVLDDVPSRWDEIGKLVDLLFELELASGRAIEAVPVSEEDFIASATPFLRNARAEGIDAWSAAS